MARQKHRGLTCGISTAYQNDLLLRTQPPLDRRSPVPDAASFIPVETLDRRTPVTRTTCNDDGFCLQEMTAFSCDTERAIFLRAIQRARFDRDHHVCAEFLRLIVGAPGERLPRNASWESEIVFDPRARSGLPAEMPRIEHCHRQTLGRRIHRSCKSGGTAADNGDVVELVLGRAADHSHRIREFGFRGIAQHGAIRTHHQRQVGRRWRITCHQFGGVFVRGGIEHVIRIAVARQESLQPHQIGKRWRADQHRPANSALNEIHTAQNQSAHNALAQIGFRDKQRTEFVRRDQQRLHIAFGGRVHERATARELSDLGQELPRPPIDHRRDMTHAIALGNADMPRQDDKHARADFAGLEQPRAVLILADLAEPAYAPNLLIRQLRKRLFESRKRHAYGLRLLSIRSDRCRLIRRHYICPLQFDRRITIPF